MNHIEAAELIGGKAWEALIAHHGGCEIAIPAKLESGAGKKLAELIGDTAAQALIQYAGGDTLYIAAGWERALGARYAEIKRLRDQGKSYAEIAREFEYTGRYTERNIRMICAGMRDDVIEAMEEFEQLLLI